MKAENPSLTQTFAPTFAMQLENICTSFERAWQQGPPPKIEDFLGSFVGEEQLSLLRELILLDVDYRRWQGESPSADHYLSRFPSLDRESLDQALAAPPSAVHRAKPPSTSKPSGKTAPAASSGSQRVRCPHCQNPIQLMNNRSEDVLCPGCGYAFRICDTRMTSSVGPMKPMGKYQLLERVGTGAFGEVWRARDTELNRIVALKIPRTGLLTAPTELERFHREARAAAQLRHPGIVAVHDVTMLDGLPVIVSDFINGVTLRDQLEIRRLTFVETASLVAKLAEALDYAHGKGLVHRDIKPANIMLEFEPDSAATTNGDDSQTAAPSRHRSPRPLVMDFGLALRKEAEVMMTVDGQIIGTPAYMSPEQAAGRGHTVDRRCDVYSLGVVLYELLGGELPFRGSKQMIVHQVLNEEPRPLRKLYDRVPRDLETICLTALAKEPSGRFATARDLADDLNRYLEGKPIRARPVGTAERAWRWCRRNRMVASLLAALAVVFLGGFVGVTAQWLRAEDNWALSEKHWQELQNREVQKQKRLADLRTESHRRLEAGRQALRRRDWVLAKQNSDTILTMIDAEAEKDADQELKKLRRDAETLLADAKKEEDDALRKRMVAERQTQAEIEVKDFRYLAGEMQFYAAGIDPDHEVARYYDTEKAQQAGKKALDIAKTWGPTLESLPLDGERNALKDEIHDFLLVLVQTSLRGRDVNVDELLDWLKRASELVGKESSGYYRLRSQCFQRKNEKQRADQALREADKLPASTVLDHFLLGEDYRVRSLGAGKTESNQSLLRRAIAEYLIARHKDPRHYWVRFQLGRCYLSQGRLAEAAEALDACIGSRPYSPWGYSATGMALALLGRFAEAEQVLKHPTVRNLNFLPARLNLGLAYYLQGEEKYSLALNELDAVLNASPEHRLIEAYYYRGQVYLAQEEYGLALADFKALLEKKEFAPAYLACAQAHFAQGQQDEGLKDLNGHLSRPGFDPTLPSAFALRGDLLRTSIANWKLPEEKQKLALDTALKQLDRAIELDWNRWETFDARGATLELSRALRMKQLLDEKARLEEIQKEIPKEIREAIQKEIQKEIREAIQAYSKAIGLARTKAEKVETLIKRGWAYLQSNDRDDYRRLDDYRRGKADFAEVTLLKPENAEGHCGLGYAHAKLNNPIAALRAATEALSYGDQDYTILHNVACIHATLSWFDSKGREDYHKAAISHLVRSVDLWEKGGRIGEDERKLIEREPAFPTFMRNRKEFKDLITEK